MIAKTIPNGNRARCCRRKRPGIGPDRALGNQSMKQSELDDYQFAEPENPHRDEDWLRERWFSPMPAKAIAEEADANYKTVYWWGRNKFGFPPKSEVEAGQPYRDEEWLRSRWFSSQTVRSIAEEANCSPDTVSAQAKEFGFAPKREATPTDGQLWKDEEWVREQYYGNGLSLSQVAEKAECSVFALRNYMDKFGMERRKTGSGSARDSKHYDPEWLRQKYYEQEQTLDQMADDAGVTAVTILRQMENHGMGRRTAGDYLRKESSTRTLDDGHEKVRFCVGDDTRYYDVHRMLAIAEFGLDEVAGKIVHHKNGIPWDNRPDNLELIESQSEHAKLHYEEREIDELGRLV